MVQVCFQATPLMRLHICRSILTLFPSHAPCFFACRSAWAMFHQRSSNSDGWFLDANAVLDRISLCVIKYTNTYLHPPNINAILGPCADR